MLGAGDSGLGAPGGAAEDSGARPGERRRLRWLRLSAFVFVPAVFVGVIAFGLFTTTTPKVLVGKEAPEFVLPMLGSTGTLSSAELKGRPVVLNFWASWCVPCREEAADLERAWRDYRDKGIQFVGVNIRDSEEGAREFIAEFGLSYPSVRDVDEQLVLKLGVGGIPETYFIDHSWKFVGLSKGAQIGTQGGTVVLGAIQPAVLRDRVDFLLSRWEEDKDRGR